MTDIAPEVVERMAKVIREIWDIPMEYKATGSRLGHAMAEVCAIVALLPEPADPDLELARKIVADAVAYGAIPGSMTASDFRDGLSDSGHLVQQALKAIKQGSQS